ncbi:MAG: transporter [Sphingomonas bacterium]
MRFALAAGLLLITTTPARAEERNYCPARPGLDTPACTIAPGRVSVETGLADWTLEQDSNQRTDTVLIGGTLVRIGVADNVEAQIGWTPYGHVRTRDKISGAVDSAGAFGDAMLGFKVNLHHPDGSGLSAAIQPFVTLPIGRSPLGAGDWGGGVVAPVDYAITDIFSLQFTPEVDTAVDQDGNGRHFAASGTIGLGMALSKKVSMTVEFQALRDADPSGKTWQAFESTSLGWMAKDNLQIDLGAVAGLNRDARDVELYVGVSRRF